jgi:hypothetical protein
MMLRCSRRRKEADALAGIQGSRINPPPYVGGYFGSWQNLPLPLMLLFPTAIPRFNGSTF